MPPIDSSIYSQFAPPVRSPEDVQNGLARGAAAGLALQNQRMQVEQAQNVMQQRNGLAQAMQGGQYDLTNPAHQAQMVAQFPDVAPTLLKTVNEGTQSAAKAKLDTSQAADADAQAELRKIQKVHDQTSLMAQQISAAKTPSDIIPIVEQHVAGGLLDKNKAIAEFDQMPKVPGPEFEAWKAAKLQQAVPVLDQMKQAFEQTKLKSEETRAAATLGESVREHKSRDAIAAGQLGVAQGRLALEKQTSGIPAGFEPDPAAAPGVRQLRPIAGGPHDPNGGGGQGSRAELMFNRVTSAGNEAAAALQNIAELPISSSTGLFGTAQPGTSLTGSAKSVLAQKMNPQEVQDTKVMFAGVARALGAIETSGLQVNGSLIHSMESVTLNEGDTQMTKLRKLAEVRQIVEKGLEPNLSNPKIPQAQKDLVTKIIADVQAAVPYTHHDITKLQQSTDPKMTISNFATSKGLGGAPTSGNSDLHRQAQEIIRGGK